MVILSHSPSRALPEVPSPVKGSLYNFEINWLLVLLY